VFQAGTLSGNPLATAAGIATLNILRDSNPYEVLRKRTARLAEGLRLAATAAGIECWICQAGAMFTFFFNPAP